ncbi:MAG: MBL fold metallo-hydrolase [Lachnospiraceae bacterium]|nr:MBL fold metallo-hydrolase [Lachnospiraceae bacterium]
MGNLKIRSQVLGIVGTNCYLAFDDELMEGVIIDPADNGPVILNQCKELGVIPKAVLLTHGHFDHICAVPDLVRAFQLPVYAGKGEENLLSDPSMNLSVTYGDGVSLKKVELLGDGEELSLLGRTWKVIATPGHTGGSVCYYLEENKVLFSGDTLFCESYGRTDFPTGNGRDLVSSVVNKLFVLPEEVNVYPGHEAQTTIGHEKKYNPLSSYQK